jgi:hypothetical protein
VISRLADCIGAKEFVNEFFEKQYKALPLFLQF